MKKLWTLMLAGLLIAAFTAPALAWEFSMKGEFEFRYRYLARTGPGDLFGNANIAQSLPQGTLTDGTLGGLAQNLGRMIGFAGPLGGAVRYGGHSLRGSDAAYTEQRMELNPEIRVNQAIRWRGIYGIQGSLNGNWFAQDGVGPAATVLNAPAGTASGAASNIGVGFGTPNFLVPTHQAGWWFVHSSNLNAESAMTSGAWRASWITAQTPWGIIAAGRRPSGFGLGWSTLHERDVTTSTLGIVAPYGPLTIILSHHLHDSGEDGEPSSNGAGRATWQSSTDQNEVRSWESAYAVRYTAGNVDVGTLTRIVNYRNAHCVGGPYDTVRNTIFTTGSGVAFAQAPNHDKSTAFIGAFFSGVAVDGNLAPQGYGITGDMDSLLQVTYLKYNNGRFFFNGEYNYQIFSARRNGGRPISGQANAWMLELGTVLGPTKFTLAHFFKSGDDRRGGRFDTNAAAGNRTVTGAATTVMAYDQFCRFLTFAGADEPLKPYQFILGIYGGGNNAFDVAGYPTWTDFVGYAARIDYAVAANLNVFMSGLYALRQSNTSTYIGQYGANGTIAQTPGTSVPNVPDDFLGIEVNAGVDWKLLEGLTFNGAFGVWQPGPWFINAYRDYTYSNLGAPSAITTANTPIERFIDPIMAFQGSLMVQF